jgi:hypothetical protein
MHVANRAPAANARPLRAENTSVPALAQRLLFDPLMNTQAHRIRGRARAPWPLYLVIAIGGAASIATSPPWWSQVQQFEGPTVTLAPDRIEEIVPFTVRFSPEHPQSDVFVYGTVEYTDADEELRIALVDPDQRTLATQFHTIQGDGRLTFSIDAPAMSLVCAEPGADECEQKLAVVFGTGGARSGTYVIDWYLTVQMNGENASPPPDLVFEVDFERGQRIGSIPYQEYLAIAPDAPGDGRWRIVQAQSASIYLDPGDFGQSMHVTMSGQGPYTASELYLPFTLSYSQYALEGEGTFRVTVVPDEPAGGVVAEHVATVSGAGSVNVALSIPEPLDCVDEIPCERGFTITVDNEAELVDTAYLTLEVQAAIDGDGALPPVDASLTLDQTPPPALSRQD